MDHSTHITRQACLSWRVGWQQKDSWGFLTPGITRKMGNLGSEKDPDSKDDRVIEKKIWYPFFVCVHIQRYLHTNMPIYFCTQTFT